MLLFADVADSKSNYCKKLKQVMMKKKDKDDEEGKRHDEEGKGHNDEKKGHNEERKTQLRNSRSVQLNQRTKTRGKVM